MIFVNTGAWFASIIPSDSDHQNAILWLTNNTQSLVTTDYGPILTKNGVSQIAVVKLSWKS